MKKTIQMLSVRLSTGLKVCVVCLLCFLSSQSMAAKTIKVGMVVDMSGGFALIGKSLVIGANAYFQSVNRQGGIEGVPLQLLAMDDGFDPQKTGATVRTLLEEEQVLAMMGNFGTQTSIVAAPILAKHETLFFAPIAAVDMLQKFSKSDTLYNFRPGYHNETLETVKGLLALGLKPQEIAVYTYEGLTGDVFMSYMARAFRLLGHEVDPATDIEQVRIPANRQSIDVEGTVMTFLSAAVEPKAFLMGLNAQAASSFIRMARDDFPDAIFACASACGTSQLIKLMGDDANGVIIPQVLPSPEGSLSGVQDYQKALQQFDKRAKPNYASFEGYVIARLLVEAMKRSEKPLSKARLLAAMDKLMRDKDYDIGFPLSLYKTQLTGTPHVWLTVIQDNQLKALDWSTLAR